VTSKGNTETGGRIEWIKAGSTDKPKTIAINLPEPQRIAVTRNYLYFTTWGGGVTNGGKKGTLMRLAKPR
jgi:hypothetical protein